MALIKEINELRREIKALKQAHTHNTHTQHNTHNTTQLIQTREAGTPHARARTRSTSENARAHAPYGRALKQARPALAPAKDNEKKAREDARKQEKTREGSRRLEKSREAANRHNAACPALARNLRSGLGHAAVHNIHYIRYINIHYIRYIYIYIYNSIVAVGSILRRSACVCIFV